MTRTRSLSPETTRLAAQAVAFARGQEADVLAWLERLGCRLVHRRNDTGEWILDGPSGVRAGFSRGLEPITAAVQLGVLFAGPFWPHVFLRLLETTDRLGRAQKQPSRASP